MSYEGWHEPDDSHEGYIHEDRVEEIFVAALQSMREFQAQVFEVLGETHPEIPNSVELSKRISALMRTIWCEKWGEDPGKPEKICYEPWDV